MAEETKPEAPAGGGAGSAAPGHKLPPKPGEDLLAHFRTSCSKLAVGGKIKPGALFAAEIMAAAIKGRCLGQVASALRVKDHRFRLRESGGARLSPFAPGDKDKE